MSTTTFEQMWRELTGFTPDLDAKQAQKFVTRAWTDICNASHWSFLQSRTVVHIPAQISTGTVAVTQFSNSITFDANAQTVLNAIGLSDPITQRQIQIDGGPAYQLLTYDSGTGIATITPALPTDGTNPGFLGATDATASYVLAKRYYAPPDVNFLRWISVTNQLVPYRFWTGVPISVIDLYDPRRVIRGNPYAISEFATGVDPLGTGAEVPLYEMWPCPAYDTQITQIYQKKNTTFESNTDTLPNPNLTDLLLIRAKYRAAEWAAANQGRLSALKGSNWLGMMQLFDKQYKEDLWKFKRQDRETMPNAIVVNMNVGYWQTPMWDANYNQISSLNADLVTGSFGFPL